MTQTTNKRKLATSVTAIALAAVMILSGTFAWQSINQEATNIVSAVVNPGGRLHDDFDGYNDKNIYVENFGTQNIFARIKLSEYLEVGQNAGKLADENGEEVDRTAIDVLVGGTLGQTNTYPTYYYDVNNASANTNVSDEYWTKQWGGSTVYIPTFNKNQDSLSPDLNGTYENTTDVDGDGIAKPYEDFKSYEPGEIVTNDEVVDADTNDIDEEALYGSYTDENITTTEDVDHTAVETLDAGVMSMAEWLALPEEDKTGNFWVYDADGWAYWASPIEPGTATGLLLTSIADLGLIDDDYYYAIHVTGQFITAGDLGQEDSTGFFDIDKGTEPTKNALKLLDTIGVKVELEKELVLDETGENGVTADVNETIIITTDNGDADIDSIVIEDEDGYILNESQYEYDPETGRLTITDDALSGTTVTVTDANEVVSGSITLNSSESDEPSDEPEEPEYFYSLSTYVSPEDYADFTGDSQFIAPNEINYIYTIADADPTQYEAEDYEVSVNISVQNRYGESVEVTEGVDYELVLDEPRQFAEIDSITSNEDAAAGVKEWCYRAELTILNEDLLSNWLCIEVVTPNSSSSYGDYIIQETVTEAIIALYEADGDHNKVTSTIVEPNSYYDIMVEVGGIVIIDTCHPENPDTNISYDGSVYVYESSGGTAEIVSDGENKGKLYTGATPGAVSGEYEDEMGGFAIAVEFYDLRIPATGEDAQDITHAYVYSQSPWLFGSDNALMTHSFSEETITAAAGKAGIDFSVVDYAGTSIAHTVTYTITGNSSADTTVLTENYDIEGYPVATLKLGADEISENITVNLSKDGYKDVSFDVAIDYTIDVLKLQDSSQSSLTISELTQTIDIELAHEEGEDPYADMPLHSEINPAAQCFTVSQDTDNKYLWTITHFANENVTEGGEYTVTIYDGDHTDSCVDIKVICEVENHSDTQQTVSDITITPADGSTDVVYLAPGEKKQYSFTCASDPTLSSPNVTWSIVGYDAEGAQVDTINLSVGDGGYMSKSATVRHDCTEGSCACTAESYTLIVTRTSDGVQGKLEGMIMHTAGSTSTEPTTDISMTYDSPSEYTVNLNTPLSIQVTKGGKDYNSYITEVVLRAEGLEAVLEPETDYTYDADAKTITIHTANTETIGSVLSLEVTAIASEVGQEITSYFYATLNIAETIAE